MACQAEAQQGTHTPAAVRWAKAGGSEGTRTLSLPADNGLLWLVELRIQRWWEVLVMLQSSLPTLVKDAGFTDRQPEHLPIGSGGRNYTGLKRFMRPSSVL